MKKINIRLIILSIVALILLLTVIDYSNLSSSNNVKHYLIILYVGYVVFRSVSSIRSGKREIKLNDKTMKHKEIQ